MKLSVLTAQINLINSFKQNQEPPVFSSIKQNMRYYFYCFVDFLMCHTLLQVDLPQWPPRVVATTWRVVMSPDAITIAPVNVLAAAMYVDSFFSPLLIPSVQLAASITSVNVIIVL